jgi:hypothetical protein
LTLPCIDYDDDEWEEEKKKKYSKVDEVMILEKSLP